MATSMLDAGSPLDDYFKDNGDSSDSSRNSWKDAMSGADSDDSAGETTLVHSQSPNSTNKGWTGPQDCLAGPSYSPREPITPRPTNARTSTLDQSPPGDYASPRELKRREAEKFAERFKYLICSSGLLEKEWVPGLGQGGDLNSKEGLTGPGRGSEVAEVAEEKVLPSWLDSLLLRIRPRRDLQAAIGVLIMALTWTAGSLLGIFGLGLVGLAFAILAYLSIPRRKVIVLTPPMPRPPPVIEPHAALLSSLTTLLASSRSLDTALDEAMRLLPPSSPISHQRALRTTLHRLCNNMTDHLASATSSLLEIVDKRELAALAVMYDIPMAGGLHGRKLSDSSTEDEPSDSESPVHHVPIASVPSPRKSSLPSQSLPAPPTQLKALAMSTTHSLPGRFKPTHSKHLSLTPSRSYRPLMLPRTAVDDRFTQLPNRTPRLSARASWDQEAFEAARNEGIRPDWTDGRVRERDRSRPRHERRITEDDEEEGDVSGSSEEPSTALVTPVMPSTYTSPTKAPGESKRIFSSPPVERYIPQRRSPLSGDPLPPRPASFNGEDIFGPSPSLDSVVGILPSTSLPVFKVPSTIVQAPKPKASENPKRRSLQSMTYYPSTSSVADDLSLTRTNSLPPSDLQALRVASASSSRRPSFASSSSANSPLKTSVSQPTTLSPLPAQTPVAESGSANATVRRVVSLSPLTLPALKAACLGVHLKRRKMACCLLGLDFAGDDRDEEEYWEEVHRLLGDLTSAMDEERATLLEIMKTSGARRWVSTSSADSSADDGSRPSPPWALASSLGAGRNDFAPRDSEVARLRRQVLGLQKQLSEAWEKVANADQAIRDFNDGEEDEVELRKHWMEIREGLGELVRQWERGREILTQLSPARLEDPIDPPPTTQAVPAVTTSDPPIPAFMQSWSESVSDSDSPIEETQDTLAMTETLPPPGVDQVFEAAPESRPDVLQGLSRDERIRLTKEARAKGLTVADLLSGSTESAQEHRERTKAGGMVVKELEGMIGLIRRRKGQPEDIGTPTAALPGDAALPKTIRRVSRERTVPQQSLGSSMEVGGGAGRGDEVFLQDLQRAFVFPKRDPVDSGQM